ncbi:MAG TPA: hypothetical protein VK338_05815 [Candidatus Nitrosocosmicus sp.]|nr:hypothetical protein [Candidatus Nitrosocosmicus sp.]
MDKKQEQNELNLNVNLDTTPILYTDFIQMVTNKNGVVLDVCQQLGPNQMRIVSRLGMSREHAKEFVKQLGSLLAMTEGQVQTGKKDKN